MDAKIENQIGRVVLAFRDAANRHWGSDEAPHSNDLPPDARTAELAQQSMTLGTNKSWVSGSETPLQKLVREHLEQRPDATAIEACRATGISYSVCKLVKKRLSGGK